MRYHCPPRLADPRRSQAACGVGFVAHLAGEPSHDCLRRALTCLVNMDHRGAEGADAATGDGAGLLFQIPDGLLRAVGPWELPPAGSYGVAVCFLPRDGQRRGALEAVLEEEAGARGLRVMGWRDVPVEPEHLGLLARDSAPVIRQLAVAADRFDGDVEALERRLYVVRRAAESVAGPELVIPSFSARTIVYKGMLSAPQLEAFYPDLRDPRCTSAVALLHARFSTNTFPSWELAHPYRLIAHNGEVNTLTGNRNWMRAREGQLCSTALGEDLATVLPTVDPDASDSATVDSVVELLVRAGRSVPHALKLLVPEAHEGREDLPRAVHDFTEFHSLLMEPWDGPAAIAFCDGRLAGAMLDRNGLRPGRWLQTRDGWVVCTSEAGALELDPADVVRRGRLEPGTLLVADLEAGRLLADREVERRLAQRRPYGRWYRERTVRLEDLDEPGAPPAANQPLRRRQLAFGYTQEDLRVLVAPMADAGKEPAGSMGSDAALAVLSERAPPLFSYFKQLFAQVTNPAIDPLREDIVMSLGTSLGPHGNLLEDTPGEACQLVLDSPVLRDDQLARVRALDHPVLRARTLDATWPLPRGASGLEPALQRLCAAAVAAVEEGATIIVLSDRACAPDRVPIPSLLATAAVHHRLVRAGTRLRAGLVVESGEPREVHHMACLVGFGANAVNPYLLLESVGELLDEPDPAPLGGRIVDATPDRPTVDDAQRAVVQALETGLLKVISKLGISTIQSYCGAQAFEAVGLDTEVVDSWFTDTASRLGGVGLDVLAEEALARHARAWPQPGWDLLPVGGLYAWRRDGERHGWNPATVTLLQDAVGGDDGEEAYADFSRRVHEDARGLTLRGLLAVRDDLEPVPIEEVEPARAIVARFATGGMSLGALSPETHETLAIAMNRLGGRSNSGEGGEDPRRDRPDPNGDSRRSSIKQVASARFGITIGHLMEADQLQIKISQGSKPGEGGQLPGSKVDEYIARLRFATPGVELISPPPHHDIYSIEDLKQLIHDLRCANPTAQVSVKLAAEVGVGTVAAGVVKAGADHIAVVGHDGGTGASPLSSIHSAGIPWELGMAETQQVLVAQGLRGRVRLQTDGQMRTGRDVVVAALLGAEEMAFSTAPLIATGCIMMRVCHLNTCPVGIATQDPQLRRRFAGTPEHVVAYFVQVAEEVRHLMAGLGVRRFDDLVGRVELLQRDPSVRGAKARRLDLAPLLAPPQARPGAARRRVDDLPASPPRDTLDHALTADAQAALEDGEPVSLDRPVRNVDRTVGGLLSHAVTRAHGHDGLAEGTIDVTLHGSAGQSLGAWLAPGVTITLHGEANDYAGKGLSGGVLVVRPFDRACGRAEEQVIAGNTLLYGATAGRAFFRGRVGERFAVRNSGAWAVVEGVGDHGCEYMTGGRVVVLGATGRNFAAGMSGGVAYVLDEDGAFPARCNLDLVELETLGADDLGLVADLVAEHGRRTGSAVAERVLDRWEQTAGCWVKVMPRDYKRALRELARQGDEERPTATVGG